MGIKIRLPFFRKKPIWERALDKVHVGDAGTQTVHYVALLAIFIWAIFGYALFSYDRALQAFIIATMGLAYFLWGVLHHRLEGDLHPKIMVEYLLVSLLGVIVVLLLLYRA